jgi:threonine/homoserine/homoserine lactone efflux protein
MNATSLLSFTLTALLIELTPGPNMAWLAALSLAEGRRAGLVAVCGVMLGLLGVGLLSVFGLSGALMSVPHAAEVLRYAGAGFLLYLAWEGWVGADGEKPPMGDGAAFRRALLTNLLNPKAAVFYLSVLPLFLPPEDGAMCALTLVLIYVAVATLVHAALVVFAARARIYVVAGSRERIIRRALALMLALVALWFFWGTRP